MSYQLNVLPAEPGIADYAVEGLKIWQQRKYDEKLAATKRAYELQDASTKHKYDLQLEKAKALFTSDNSIKQALAQRGDLIPDGKGGWTYSKDNTKQNEIDKDRVKSYLDAIKGTNEWNKLTPAEQLQVGQIIEARVGNKPITINPSKRVREMFPEISAASGGVGKAGSAGTGNNTTAQPFPWVPVTASAIGTGAAGYGLFRTLNSKAAKVAAAKAGDVAKAVTGNAGNVASGAKTAARGVFSRVANLGSNAVKATRALGTMPITEAGLMRAGLYGAGAYFGGKAVGNLVADAQTPQNLQKDLESINSAPAWLRPVITGMSNSDWDKAYNSVE